MHMTDPIPPTVRPGTPWRFECPKRGTYEQVSTPSEIKGVVHLLTERGYRLWYRGVEHKSSDDLVGIRQQSMI